jgi:hypothetical protein
MVGAILIEVLELCSSASPGTLAGGACCICCGCSGILNGAAKTVNIISGINK